MSPRWFGVDSSGELGVFVSEHIVPMAARGPEEDLDLALQLTRLLRTDHRPAAGIHVKVRAGDVLMIATAASVREYAVADAVTSEVVAASFAPVQRGRAATFMPGIRTFGTGDAEELSNLERAHAAGVCAGCVTDDCDYDESALHALGFYVYECDEEQEQVERALVPSTPLHLSRIGALARKFLRFTGTFASSASFGLRAFKRP